MLYLFLYFILGFCVSRLQKYIEPEYEYLDLIIDVLSWPAVIIVDSVFVIMWCFATVYDYINKEKK